MNPKHPFRPLSLTFIAGLSLLTLAQERNAADDVRDAFLVTRQKVAAAKGNQPANSSRAKGRRQVGYPSGVSPAPTGPIGLGYTLYKRDSDGSPVRVDLSQEFHKGDAVRL